MKEGYTLRADGGHAQSYVRSVVCIVSFHFFPGISGRRRDSVRGNPFRPYEIQEEKNTVPLVAGTSFPPSPPRPKKNRLFDFISFH